ncbi:MAG: 4-hydroxy-tetrahydrodipicolinate synthase [Chlamydiales bacterium]|jgi:4-hydroxy-tetrahydrodipicolinate synthase
MAGDTMKCPLRGSLVALPAPFLPLPAHHGALDLDAYRRMVEEQIERGTDGLVVNGTTGESCTLSAQERNALLETAIEAANGRVPVVAGVGTNDTRSSVANTRAAADAGADALLVVTPYYNRPDERGLAHHFGAVAEATKLPVVLYNVPGRTGVDLLPTWAREIGRRHENVVAIKEATTSRQRARAVCRDSGLAVFCGEDSLIAEFTHCGAVGAINVVGNILPEALSEWLRALRPDGSPRRADEIERVVLPMVRALSIATNPIPVKAALSILGKCSDAVRAPLLPLEEHARAILTARCLEACVPA